MTATVNPKEDYIFFWGGEMSQWHESPFHDLQGRKFNCAEQYMMASKAALFKDIDSYNAIMATEDPSEQKALGKKVKNFDKDEWEEIAIDVVTTGNYFKFTQSPTLYAYLLSTENKHLVEASPYDKIWGIGLAEDEPNIEDMSTWQGTNWLGLCIMRARKLMFKIDCIHGTDLGGRQG